MSETPPIQDVEAQIVPKKSLKSSLKAVFFDAWNPIKLYFSSFPMPLCICDNRNMRAIAKNITIEDTYNTHNFSEKRIVILQAQPFE